MLTSRSDSARDSVVKCRCVHRRRGRVRPLHGPVLDAARAADGRLRASGPGTTRRRRRVRTGRADDRARAASRARRRVGRRSLGAVRRRGEGAPSGRRRPPRVGGAAPVRRRRVRRCARAARRPLHGRPGQRAAKRCGRATAARRRRGRVRLGPRRRHGAAEPVLGGCALTRRRRRRTSPSSPAPAKAISRSCSSRRGWATSRTRRSPSPSSSRASTSGGQPFTRGVGPAGAYVASLDAEQQARLRELCRSTSSTAWGPSQTVRAWARARLGVRRSDYAPRGSPSQ